MIILAVFVSFSHSLHIVNIDICPLCQSIGLNVLFLVAEFFTEGLISLLNDEILHNMLRNISKATERAYTASQNYLKIKETPISSFHIVPT